MTPAVLILSIDFPMHNAGEACPHLILASSYRSHVLVSRLQSHGGCFYIYRYCSPSMMNMMTTTTLSVLDKATQRVR